MSKLKAGAFFVGSVLVALVVLKFGKKYLPASVQAWIPVN